MGYEADGALFLDIANASEAFSFVKRLNAFINLKIFVVMNCEKLTIDNGEGESQMMFFVKQVEWFLSVATHNNFVSKMVVFMGLVAIDAKDVSTWLK